MLRIKKPLFISFIYLEKVFDNINRAILFMIMEDLTIDQRFPKYSYSECLLELSFAHGALNKIYNLFFKTKIDKTKKCLIFIR